MASLGAGASTPYSMNTLIIYAIARARNSNWRPPILMHFPTPLYSYDCLLTCLLTVEVVTRELASVYAVQPLLVLPSWNRSLMMACCRCNKAGTCKSRSCAKGWRNCDNCLPSRLNKCHDDVLSTRKDIRASNRQHSEDQANVIYSQLTPQLKCYVDLAKERGASSWLSVLPLSEQGFHLHKGEFRDALCLCYGWTLSNTPRLCNCGKAFTINHAMVCHMGGFPTIRHTEIRDLTASMLT